MMPSLVELPCFRRKGRVRWFPGRPPGKFSILRAEWDGADANGVPTFEADYIADLGRGFERTFLVRAGVACQLGGTETHRFTPVYGAKRIGIRVRQIAASARPCTVGIQVG